MNTVIHMTFINYIKMYKYFLSTYRLMQINKIINNIYYNY